MVGHVGLDLIETATSSLGVGVGAKTVGRVRRAGGRVAAGHKSTRRVGVDGDGSGRLDGSQNGNDNGSGIHGDCEKVSAEALQVMSELTLVYEGGRKRKTLE